MPLYEYKCIKCNYKFDTMKTIKEFDNKEICPKCSGEAKIIIAPVPFTFK